MKKILFYAGLLTLAVGCTDDTFETAGAGAIGKAKKAEGITFTASGVDTRIMYELKDDNGQKSLARNWFAETDSILLWAAGVKKGADAYDPNSDVFKSSDGSRDYGVGYWKNLSIKGDSVIYKATSSGTTGKFTSVDKNNLLAFRGNPADEDGADSVAQFFAIYPATVKPDTTGWRKGNGASTPDTIALSGVLRTIGKKQHVELIPGTSKLKNDSIVMYAYANKAKRKYNYESVGEKANLTFKYATPVLTLRLDSLNEDYLEAFGKLQEVVVTEIGGKDANGNKVKAPSLGYSGNAKNAKGPRLLVDTLNFDVKIDTLGCYSNVDSLKVKIGKDGEKWNSEYVVPVAAAEAERTVEDTLVIMWKFENLDAKFVNKQYKAEWKAGNIYSMQQNINKKTYLVTKAKDKGQPQRTLFVNSGKLKEIFDSSGRTLAVRWEDSQTGNFDTVQVWNIRKVVIKDGVDMTDDDFGTYLNNFSNLEELQILGYTSIPAEGLKSLTKLKKLVMPKATSVANASAFHKALALDSVVMPMYAFDNDAINSRMLKKDNLHYIEMGADELAIDFGAKGMSFNGFTELHTVVLSKGVAKTDNQNPTGVKAGSNSFRGCVKLKEVKGLVNITEGSYVFAGDSLLTSVNITSNKIPAGSFMTCYNLKNENLKVNGEAIKKLAAAGNEAFKNTAQLNFDLSECTEVGDSAFANAKGLEGYQNDGDNVKILRVAATTIGKGAFAGCSQLHYLEFGTKDSGETMTVGDGFLGATTANTAEVAQNVVKIGRSTVTLAGETTKLNQLRFYHLLDVTKGLAEGSFGDCGNTDLFIRKAQKGKSGNNIVMGAGTTDDPKVTFTFKQINQYTY